MAGPGTSLTLPMWPSLRGWAFYSMSPFGNGTGLQVLEMPDSDRKPRPNGRQVGVSGMKTIWKISGVLAMSLVLAGCGGASRLLGGMGLGSSSPAPQAPVVRTGNNLALPPDLQLRPPGTAHETYQANPAPAAPVQTASAEKGLSA